VAGEAHVELLGVSKRFGGAQALTDVDLTVARGEIRALVGENGAGKSTLGKVIAGLVAPDAGSLHVDGRAVSYRSPRQALDDGITLIAQELALVPDRSVIENVFLGTEASAGGVVRERRLRARFAELTARAGFDLPADATVGALRVAEQQKVEILRALAREARLIVMDEPTAALTADEAQRLFAMVRSLREQGTTIVYVSHFLDEVLALADTVTVLKDGRLIRTSAASEETADTLVTAMLGRSLEVTFPPKQLPPADAPVVFRATGLTRAGALGDVSLEIRRGEILGLAGLVGSGRSEVARAIFGADRLDAGEMELEGKPVRPSSPRQAIDLGIAMLPESRKTQGLLMGRSVTENVSLAHMGSVSRLGVMSRRAERREVVRLTDALDVRPVRHGAAVGQLSGGNQQKVLFARWLFRRPRLLIADEPTRGVDIGAKAAIYALLRDLAAEGMAVLLISSELEEVLGLAHRVVVMREGRVMAELEGDEMVEEAVMRAAFDTAVVPA
jgi:ABC-type sugar transport system ATPase subunit